VSDKLRFGIIGCGVIGPTHAQALKELNDVAELVAVADVIPERAQKLASAHGATAYTDFREMLARPDIDVVDVCTPSGLHGAHAMEVLKAGKHVIIEKPVDISLEVIDRLLEVQKASGKKAAVISQHRFSPDVVKLKKAVDSGKLGRLTMGNSYTHWWRSQEYYNSGDWRGTWALDGGGALMNQSIHYIDLIQWIMGDVESISAFTDTLCHDIEVEDTATGNIRFKNGALGVIQGCTSANPGLYQKLEVYGDKGCVSITYSSIDKWVIPGESAETSEESQTANGAADPRAIGIGGHTAQIYDMIKAIREDRDPLVTIPEGRKGVSIILGIYESARTGQIVKPR
jgi:UDP-N-acetyl-2-amino-2-deoxyglucuronate dehydrogenase